MMPSTPKSRSRCIRSASLTVHVDLQAARVGGAYEAPVDHRHARLGLGHLGGDRRVTQRGRDAVRAQPQPHDPLGAVRGRQTRPGQTLGAEDPRLGERADADAVPGVEAADEVQHGVEGGFVLDVDVPADVGEGFEELLEERDRFLARHARVAHVLPGELRDPARAVRHPVQGRVVEGDELAVRRRVHIRLDIAVARLNRAAELDDGVLQTVRRTAPVGEGDRAGVVEVRVAYARAHPGSIARSG